MRRALTAGCLLLTVTGCSGLAPQQVGQVLGTVAGSVLAPGLGAPIGGLVGLLTGMVVQKKVDAVTEQRERVELGEQLAAPPPGAAPEAHVPPLAGAAGGGATRVWVDEAWRNGRVIAGSFEQRYIP